MNSVAAALGLDQSGASRLIQSAVASEYLATTPSVGDGRRREVSLTASGRAMLDQAHRWQEQLFAQLTAEWSEQRRREFETSMLDLVRRSHELGGA